MDEGKAKNSFWQDAKSEFKMTWLSLRVPLYYIERIHRTQREPSGTGFDEIFVELAY